MAMGHFINVLHTFKRYANGQSQSETEPETEMKRKAKLNRRLAW